MTHWTGLSIHTSLSYKFLKLLKTIYGKDADIKANSGPACIVHAVSKLYQTYPTCTIYTSRVDQVESMTKHRKTKHLNVLTSKRRKI